MYLCCTVNILPTYLNFKEQRALLFQLSRAKLYVQYYPKNCYFYIRVINVSKTLDTQPKISKIQYSNLYIVNGNVSKKLFLYLFLVPWGNIIIFFLFFKKFEFEHKLFMSMLDWSQTPRRKDMAESDSAKSDSGWTGQRGVWLCSGQDNAESTVLWVGTGQVIAVGL